MSASPDSSEKQTSKTVSGDSKTLGSDSSKTFGRDNIKRSASDSPGLTPPPPFTHGSQSPPANNSPLWSDFDAIMSNNEDSMAANNITDTSDIRTDRSVPLPQTDEDVTIFGNEDTSTSNVNTANTHIDPSAHRTSGPSTSLPAWADREKTWGLPMRKIEIPAWAQKALDNVAKEGVEPLSPGTMAKYENAPRGPGIPVPWLAELLRKAKEEAQEGSDFGDLQEADDQAAQPQFVDTRADGGFLNPNAGRSNRHRIHWTAENDRQVLLFGLGRHMSRAEIKAIADSFPEKPTEKAVEERLNKLRAQQRTMLRENGIYDADAPPAGPSPSVSRTPSTSRRRSAKKARTESAPTSTIPAFPQPEQQQPPVMRPPATVQPPSILSNPSTGQASPTMRPQPPQSMQPPQNQQRSAAMRRPASAGSVPTIMGIRRSSMGGFQQLTPSSPPPGHQQLTTSGQPYHLAPPPPPSFKPFYGYGLPHGLGGVGGPHVGGGHPPPGLGFLPGAWIPQHQPSPAAHQQTPLNARDQPQQDGASGIGTNSPRRNTGATATQDRGNEERARRERSKTELEELKKRLGRK